MIIFQDFLSLEIAGVEYTQKFLQYIYNNSQIYLDRKYEKYYGSNAGLATQKWVVFKVRKKTGTLKWESEWKAMFKSMVTRRA